MTSSSELAPLLELSNELKRQASKSLLTENQKTAVKQIEDVLASERLVVLSGPPLSGKTFIGWVLVNQGYDYARWPAEQFSSDQVVVDDAPSDRVDARSCRAQCGLDNVSRCVYITRHRLSYAETIPQVQLTLNQDEEQSIITKWVEISESITSGDLPSLASAREHLNNYNK
jgi:hypothetical protein